MSEVQSTVNYRPVAGFPGYRVGDDGSVWSRWKKLGRGRHNGTRQVLGDNWHQMQPSPGTRGHLLVTLCPGRHMRHVHRLVLEAFVGLRPQGMQARHFPDRNPANNALSNLQWGTPKQNQADRIIHGTAMQGSKHPMAILTEEDVQAIRAEWAAHPHNQRALGRKYGVTQATIHMVVTRKVWKHVP